MGFTYANPGLTRRDNNPGRNYGSSLLPWYLHQPTEEPGRTVNHSYQPSYDSIRLMLSNFFQSIRYPLPRELQTNRNSQLRTTNPQLGNASQEISQPGARGLLESNLTSPR